MKRISSWLFYKLNDLSFINSWSHSLVYYNLSVDKDDEIVASLVKYFRERNHKLSFPQKTSFCVISLCSTSKLIIFSTVQKIYTYSKHRSKHGFIRDSGTIPSSIVELMLTLKNPKFCTLSHTRHMIHR